LTILDDPTMITGHEKASIIELTYQLGNSLCLISTEAFIHAFQGSLAIQRFFREPNQLLQGVAKDHLIAIREIFGLDVLFKDESPKQWFLPNPGMALKNDFA